MRLVCVRVCANVCVCMCETEKEKERGAEKYRGAQQTKLDLRRGNMRLKWAQGLFSPLYRLMHNLRSDLNCEGTHINMHARSLGVLSTVGASEGCSSTAWVQSGIRALSDGALSSRRLKVTHHLSAESGFHKYISIPLNPVPHLKLSDNLLTIKTVYVMLTSPQMPPHEHAHTHTHVHSIWHNCLYP